MGIIDIVTPINLKEESTMLNRLVLVVAVGLITVLLVAPAALAEEAIEEEPVNKQVKEERTKANEILENKETLKQNQNRQGDNGRFGDGQKVQMNEQAEIQNELQKNELTRERKQVNDCK